MWSLITLVQIIPFYHKPQTTSQNLIPFTYYLNCSMKNSLLYIEIFCNISAWSNYFLIGRNCLIYSCNEDIICLTLNLYLILFLNYHSYYLKPFDYVRNCRYDVYMRMMIFNVTFRLTNVATQILATKSLWLRPNQVTGCPPCGGGGGGSGDWVGSRALCDWSGQ